MQWRWLALTHPLYFLCSLGCLLLRVLPWSHTLQLDSSAGRAETTGWNGSVSFQRNWWLKMEVCLLHSVACCFACHKCMPNGAFISLRWGQVLSYVRRWLQRLHDGHSCADPSPGGSSQTVSVHCRYTPHCPAGSDLNRSRRKPGSWPRWPGHIQAACTPHGRSSCPSHHHTLSPKSSCSGPLHDPDSYCYHLSNGFLVCLQSNKKDIYITAITCRRFLSDKDYMADIQ